MYTEKETIKAMQLSNELLEIIENVDNFTQSDLQGVLQARVITNVILQKKKQLKAMEKIYEAVCDVLSLMEK